MNKKFRYSNRLKIKFVPAVTDDSCCFHLSQRLEHDLKDKVSFGVQVLTDCDISSAWVYEVMDPKWTPHDLSFPYWRQFIQLIPDLADFFEQTDDDVYIMLGIDVDYLQQNAEAQLQYLTHMWKYEARVYLERTR